MDDAAYLAEDARDRRAALAFAQSFVYVSPARDQFEWPPLADEAYRWLQQRDSLRAASISLIAGTPIPEGEIPVTATIDLSDIDEVTFTLSAVDAKGAEVPVPSDTWNWALADPDGTGSTLTVSADTLSATVAAGTPDTTGTLTLTVTGASTGLTGAEAILVVASAAATIGLVAGTPTAEPAPS